MNCVEYGQVVVKELSQALGRIDPEKADECVKLVMNA